MAKAKEAPPLASDLELFLRVWDREKMTPALARSVLNWKFTSEEEARIHELMEKNRESDISSVELQELETYVRVWAAVSARQSRARLFLKRRSKAGAGRG
jgi:hypothetical protein